jgi:hypothetical protein
MKTYEVEIKRTGYITYTVEAEDEDAAEAAAWKLYDEAQTEGSAEIEYIEEVVK